MMTDKEKELFKVLKNVEEQGAVQYQKKLDSIYGDSTYVIHLDVTPHYKRNDLGMITELERIEIRRK